MRTTTLTSDVVSRLRRTVSTIDLDCRSRATLERAFDRFVALERRREIRSAIVAARTQKDRIARFLGLLAELDELNEHEEDGSAFAEMAVLFDEIARCATVGAMTIGAIATLPARQDTRTATSHDPCLATTAYPDCRRCRAYR